MTSTVGIITKVLKQGRPGSNSFVLMEYEDPDTGDLKVARMGGAIGSLTEGDAFDATGKWTTNQFRGATQEILNARSVRPGVPVTVPGIEKYLEGQLNLYSMEHKANLKAYITDHGAETISVIVSDMDGFFDAIYSIDGKVAPEERRGSAYTKARDRLVMKLAGRKAMDLMKEAEIDESSINGVMSHFRSNPLKVIEENPYDIVDVPSIDFATADRLGKKFGISDYDERRIVAALQDHLKSAENQGSSVVALKGAIQEVCEKHRLEEDVVTDLVRAKINGNNQSKLYVAALPDYDRDIVIKKSSLQYEISAAQTILDIIQKGRRNNEVAVEKACEEVLSGSQLDEFQRKAVQIAATHPMSIITGGPGTGKSTILKSMIKVSRMIEDAEIIVTAPTGKAASRAEETTGLEAQTVHMLLGMKEGADGKTTFSRNRNNPLPENCVVIVDEISMMDNELFSALLAAMPRSGRLVLQGDPNQLPSVGVGRVLADLIEMNIDGKQVVPIGRLVNVYRQDNDSKIISDSIAINDGKVPVFGEGIQGGVGFLECESSEITDKILNLYTSQLSKIPDLDMLKEVSVICPQAPGYGGTHEVNRALSRHLNPNGEVIPGLPTEFADGSKRPVPRVGDRIILTENDHEQKVINGDTGVITGYEEDPDNPKNTMIKITFDRGKEMKIPASQHWNLLLSYAITCHKSQGSEYKFVILPFSDMHSKMAKRSLLFTAWTRASQVVLGVGEKKILEKAVANNTDDKRYTIMRRLVEMWGAGKYREGKLRVDGLAQEPIPYPCPPIDAFREKVRETPTAIKRPTLAGISSRPKIGNVRPLPKPSASSPAKPASPPKGRPTLKVRPRPPAATDQKNDVRNEADTGDENTRPAPPRGMGRRPMLNLKRKVQVDQSEDEFESENSQNFVP